MFITPSFKKSLIVEQFQGNYLKQVKANLQLQLSRMFIIRSVNFMVVFVLQYFYKLFAVKTFLLIRCFKDLVITRKGLGSCNAMSPEPLRVKFSKGFFLLLRISWFLWLLFPTSPFQPPMLRMWLHYNSVHNFFVNLHAWSISVLLAANLHL